MKRIAVISCIFLIGISTVTAEEGTKMDPEQAAAMEAAMKLGSPSEDHEALKPFAGDWTYELKWRLGPEAPAQEMTGRTKNTLIFGGRFLQQNVSGDATEDHPAFEGMGFTGYDNIRKEYTSVWFDNMSTGIMKATGQFDAVAKSISEKGNYSCPMTGESHKKFRAVWTNVDENHNTYASYQYTPEGQEFKAMEIHYTRAE